MTFLPTARTPGSAIGVDIGSGAVRAAEVTRTRRGLACRRFAQVGLPRGAVVDGEVTDQPAVSAALRRLWSAGGFSRREVVLAISGQRVIVRQADVPSMSESDFRSSLSFQAMDLIPIPVDEAVLDFMILPPPPGRTPPAGRMRILLAAAHRQALDGHLAALRGAGLRAVGVDPAPTALVRATRRGNLGENRTVAVVDVGADLTLVAVRDQGILRFARVLNAGGSDLTERVAARLAVAADRAESLKRRASSAGGAGSLLTAEVDPLVAEIESSMTYFASQLGDAALEEVWVTGGPSKSPELVAELARRLPVPVAPLDALAELDLAELDLDEAGRAAASCSGLVAVGAAEWAFDPAGARLCLVPPEAAALAARRRGMALAAGGVVVVALALAGLGALRDHQVSSARHQAIALRAADIATQARIDALSPAFATHTALAARLSVLDAVSADNVDWPALLRRISAAMPPGTHLSSLSFTDEVGSSGATAQTSPLTTATSSSTSGTTGPAAAPLGSVTMQVSGPPEEREVADWLVDLARTRGLSDIWVPSAEIAGSQVSFTSTAVVDQAAPLVTRPLTGGGPR